MAKITVRPEGISLKADNCEISVSTEGAFTPWDDQMWTEATIGRLVLLAYDAGNEEIEIDMETNTIISPRFDTVEWRLSRMLPMVAESWDKLRGCDIYRLYCEFEDYERKMVAALVAEKRPDLAEIAYEDLAQLEQENLYELHG